MRLIYIAGPFRAPTLFEITQNVAQAEYWGLQVAKLGHMPVIPHANTWKMYGAAPEELFLRGTELLLTKCDGSIFIPGWQFSSGSRSELKVCDHLRIPTLDLELEESDANRRLLIKTWLEKTFK